MNLNIVLFNPEIPHNTGAIGRVCVCLGARLHLVQPLGFSLSDRHLRRAGLDYWKDVDLILHRSWDHFLETEHPRHMSFVSAKSRTSYFEHRFHPGEYIVFGPEADGLPQGFHSRYPGAFVTIPMPGPHARSLNLATAAAVVAYEAYRQVRQKG